MAGKEFFHSDNPFNEMLTRVFNLLELNLLWIIFSLPIITVGAATAALYTLCFRMLSNQETSIFKEFVSRLPQTLNERFGDLLSVLKEEFEK